MFWTSWHARTGADEVIAETDAEDVAAHRFAERLMDAADAHQAERDAEAAETGAAGDYAIEDADSADDDRRAVWRLLGL